jgi:hypothetical protein
MIRDDKIHQIPTAMQTGANVGMQTLAASIESKRLEAKLAPEVAAKAQAEFCGATTTPMPATAGRMDPRARSPQPTPQIEERSRLWGKTRHGTR